VIEVSQVVAEEIADAAGVVGGKAGYTTQVDVDEISSHLGDTLDPDTITLGTHTLLDIGFLPEGAVMRFFDHDRVGPLTFLVHAFDVDLRSSRDDFLSHSAFAASNLPNIAHSNRVALREYLLDDLSLHQMAHLLGQRLVFG